MDEYKKESQFIKDDSKDTLITEMRFYRRMIQYFETM